MLDIVIDHLNTLNDLTPKVHMQLGAPLVVL
jgi:hypothetical protein